MNQNYEYIKPRKSNCVKSGLDPLVKEWFFSKFKDFSLTQLYGVMPIFERKNILVSAPTGGTKTLTAFLSILNYLVGLAKKEELEGRVYAVYCSPLKALSNDISINLKNPLKEIEELAKKKGIKMQKIRVGLRTGDTSQSERARMSRKPPHILVTTPESLAIMINSPKFSERFNMVEFMILDEIHSLAENKRGVHLSLTIERLQELSLIPLTRIGLSATVAPLEDIANFLVGQSTQTSLSQTSINENEKQNNFERSCLIAKVDLKKNLDLNVLSPVEDFLNTGSADLHRNFYGLIDELIQKHKTTLIFTNTRNSTERVVHHLKDLYPQSYTENIGAHHSSLSKDHRFNLEQRLREGK